MNEIWANRLIAGTQSWERCVKTGRAMAVKAILQEKVVDGKITADDYARITGEDFAEVIDG